jgi:hypothetical protein
VPAGPRDEEAVSEHYSHFVDATFAHHRDFTNVVEPVCQAAVVRIRPAANRADLALDELA